MKIVAGNSNPTLCKEVAGYLGIAQDITDRLWNESVLRHAKAKAESASAVIG